jgi:hypothetical protein
LAALDCGLVHPYALKQPQFGEAKFTKLPFVTLNTSLYKFLRAAFMPYRIRV